MRFRIHSLRFRIAAAYIVGALLVSGTVAVGTYVITSRVLTDRNVESAQVRSFEELAFLRAEIHADQNAVTRGEPRRRETLREYLEPLQQRGTDMVAEVVDMEPVSTSVGLTVQAIPDELRRAVQGGQVAWAIGDGFGHRQIVLGSAVPDVTVRQEAVDADADAAGAEAALPEAAEEGEGEHVHAYFFYSLENVDRTLSLLSRVLLGVVAVAVLVAAAVGLRLADRTIRPLRTAADAARRVAGGHLETRLEEQGDDELARLARDFNRMTRALEERIARERRFVADVSHELRTPLTTLKTSIDYVADRVAELSPKLRSAVGLATEEVRSLGRLVDDLLELTRVESGGVEVAWEDVDLRAFADEVVRRRASTVPVEIVGPDQLVARTDKARLERVVGNLVENAVVHGGGKDVRITLDGSNGTARIVVADNGPGIPEGQLNDVFERFWRGDASRRRDGATGAGLGLAIARENAKVIGADLLVHSAVGEGTTFEVLLPAGEDV